MIRGHYPEGELDRAVVGLETHWTSLLQDGLVCGMQTFAHYRNGISIVSWLQVIVIGCLVGVVLILLLFSQQIRV